MNVTLAVVGHHSSEPVKGRGGAPIDLSNTTLPTSAEDPAAGRLFGAVEAAVRDMRLRAASTPAGAEAPLRLGLIVTTEAGTNLEVNTTPPNLQEVDLHDSETRATLLSNLRNLERSVVTDR